MANRHTLHISKLEDFKEWLVKDGWEIEEPKGIYEVLRARKYGRQNPLIVYTKADVKEHLRQAENLSHSELFCTQIPLLLFCSFATSFACAIASSIVISITLHFL